MMDHTTRAAFERLLQVANSDTGQSRLRYLLVLSSRTKNSTATTSRAMARSGEAAGTAQRPSVKLKRAPCGSSATASTSPP